MLTLDIAPERLILLAGLLLLATWRDLRRHRIDNWITFPGALLALGLQAYLGGSWGLIDALAGLSLGLIFLLPFYALGGMAAGDVKLMAAAGACLGAEASVWAVLYSLIAGAVLALCLLGIKREFFSAAQHIFRQIWGFASTRIWVKASDIADTSQMTLSQRFPYAAAIAGGCLVLAFWGSPGGV